MTTTPKTERKATGKPDETVNFEKAMARLEKIVSEMESGELPLEDMIARFEEGQGLITFCTGKLNEVEKKVEMLVKKGGEIVTVPFDADAGDTAAEEAGPSRAALADDRGSGDMPF